MLADSGAVLAFAETDAHAEHDRAAQGRAARPAQGAAHRRVRHRRRSTRWPRPAKRSTPPSSTTRLAGIQAADPATLIYTSGTTGRPKGCQLTHSNLLYEIRGAKACFPTLLAKGERMLVFLPLAHVLARAITIAAFANKVTLGFTSDIKNLVPMFGVFKPTLVVSVPRVFEKVYNTAEQNARNDGKGRIFDDRRQHRDRVEQGPGHRRAGPAAAGQARGVRPAGLRQAARRARRQTATPRSPAARRWARGSATSTAASG